MKFKTEYFAAVGSGERVRIYRYTRQRVGRWFPVFTVKRSLYRAGVYARDALPLVDMLNGGSRFEARRRIVEAHQDGGWSDEYAVY